MIAIQLILAAGIIYLLTRFLANPSSSTIRAWKKILVILFTILAIVVILFPQTANDIAHALGVGRGADLLLYLLTLAFILLSLNLYQKAKQDEQRLAVLARKVALLEAELNQQIRKSHDK